tara:strand:- start:264 stop:581 length:318 start_codon:yes stop_codon:yes gene_type:complete
MLIYIDIDGTICTQEKNTEYDKAEPYFNRIAKVNKLFEEGHQIHYWTARGKRSGIDWKDVTTQQLEKWGCKYHDITVGTKPHFDMYICDKSFNADSYFSCATDIR